MGNAPEGDAAALPTGSRTLLSDRGWLYARYVREQLTLREISALLGCSHDTVWAALQQHRISRRPPARRFTSLQIDDPVWLRERYEHNGQTTLQIAQELGVTPKAVNQALRRHGIPLRSRRHQGADATKVSAPAGAETISE